MKKTPVIVLNLKFMRIIFLLLLFPLTVFLSIFLSRSFSPPCLSSAFISASLDICPACSSNKTESQIFSLLKREEKETISQKKEAEQKTSSPPENEDVILARTPTAGAFPTEVKINNFTNHPIDVSTYANEVPAFLKEDFSVLIVHTHTTESYTPSEKYSYIPTDTDRTQDKNYNMVRVGDEIEKILKENNINVYHDTTINDYPSYNGSYNRCSTNVTNYLKNNPSIKIVLDVHRDAIEGKNGEKIKYTSEIEGKTAASIMLVAGSNLSGLSHDSWETNLRFAVQLQQYTNKMYPGLCRPINFRSQRFNQQLAPGAIIVEVGTNGNTLDEALLGSEYFAKSLSQFIKDMK